jgi:hypothetical protein
MAKLDLFEVYAETIAFIKRPMISHTEHLELGQGGVPAEIPKEPGFVHQKRDVGRLWASHDSLHRGIIF